MDAEGQPAQANEGHNILELSGRVVCVPQMGGVFSGNRLTDLQGEEWRRGRRLTVIDAQSFVRRDGRVAVYGTEGEPITWLEGSAGLEYRERVGPHVEAADNVMPVSVENLFTYLADLWSQGDRRLVGIQVAS